MKFSTKVALGLFAIAGLTAIYYGDNYYTQKKEERTKEASYAIYFETKDVLGFKIKNKNGEYTYLDKSSPNYWAYHLLW